MSLHNEIKAHAKLVAKDVKAGKASAYCRRARDFMQQVPDATLGVIDLAHREANRKKSDDAMVQAYVYLFANGLEPLRYEIERGQDWAEELVDAVREQLLLLVKGGIIPPYLLLLLLNGFVEAKIEPGDELTELLGDIALKESEHNPEPTLDELRQWFETLVDEANGNEFDVYLSLADVTQALPPEFRMANIPQIATADNPVLRDTAVLFLLDRTPEVRRTVCRVFAENASPSFVSPVALRRMIALRNWLPETERHHLDAAIKKARQKQVQCASWPRRNIEQIFASNMDGAGAQSVFCVIKEGRRYVIASLLVKQGVGIADAWCVRNQSKADVRDFLDNVRSQTDSNAIDVGFLDLLVPHYLAVGRESGHVPTPGLLDFVEALGIEKWQPSELGADRLVALLEAGANPARLSENSVAEVIEKSDLWFDEFDFTRSWFEQDAEVEAFLAARARSKPPTQVNAVIKSILEPRRAKWAERFLWTALWLKQEQDLLSPWLEFFVVGRELHRGRPLKDIPAMRSIAELTVVASAEAGF